MTKRRALLLFLAVVFLGSLAEEALWANRGNPGWALPQGALGAIFVYWWYHLDKLERQFKAGILQNMSVAVISFIGLPVYFVRSRGWKRGGLAIAWAFGFMLIMFAASLGGLLIGRQIALHA